MGHENKCWAATMSCCRELNLLEAEWRVLPVKRCYKPAQPTSLRAAQDCFYFSYLWLTGNFPQAAGTESFSAHHSYHWAPDKSHTTCVSRLRPTLSAFSSVLWIWKTGISGFTLVAVTWSVFIFMRIGSTWYFQHVPFQFHTSLSRKGDCVNCEISFGGLELHSYIFVQV